MVAATGRIPTDRAGRYIKQLLSHVGRKLDVEEGDPTSRLRVADARVALTATPEAVLIEASADAEQDLFRAMYVVQSHIERFGTKNELVTAWDDPDLATRYEPLHEQWLAERAERKAREAAEREAGR